MNVNTVLSPIASPNYVPPSATAQRLKRYEQQYGWSEGAGGATTVIAPNLPPLTPYHYEAANIRQPSAAEDAAYAQLVYGGPGGSTPTGAIIPYQSLPVSNSYAQTVALSNQIFQSSMAQGGIAANNPSKASNNSRSAAINTFFDYHSQPGLEVRYDLGLQARPYPRSEIASGYAPYWPDLANAYVSGKIDYMDMFRGALLTASTVDRAMNLSGLTKVNYSPPPKININFTSSGGSISWTGGGIRW